MTFEATRVRLAVHPRVLRVGVVNDPIGVLLGPCVVEWGRYVGLLCLRVVDRGSFKGGVELPLDS